MSDEIVNGAVPPASPQAAAPASPDGAQSAPQPSPERSDEVRLSWKEFVDFRREVREALKGREPQATPAEKPKAQAQQPDGELAGRLAALERENALIRAYADHGIQAGPARDAIELAARHVPAQELRTLVEAMVKAFPRAPAAAPASPSPSAAVEPAPAAPSQRSDGGPPAAAAPNVQPTSLVGLSREAALALSSEERLELLRRGGANSNPYAALAARRRRK